MVKGRYTLRRHWIFLKIFRTIFGPFFRIYYRFKAKKIKIKKTGPYLILANHTAEFDIIFLDMLFDAPLYFVASEQLLNAGKGSWFLRTFFNPIPKSKSIADLAVVKRIKNVLIEGGNVAIFPEGNASMNGGPSRIPLGMGRLIKFLNVPVKFIRIDGLYLSAPRWAYFRKFGASSMQEITTLSLDDISQLNPDELETLVKNTLHISAYDHPQTPFYGRRRAEGLHKLIFTCPQCHGLFTTFSRENQLLCHQCDFSGTYDEFGFLHVKNQALPLTQLDTENKLRFAELMKKQFQSFSYQAHGEVAYWSGGKTKRTPFYQTKVEFSENGVKLTLKDKIQVIPYPSIFAEAIQVRTKLILYPVEGPSLLLRFPREYSPYAMMMVIQWFKLHFKKGNYHELDANNDGTTDSLLGI
jgi:1-acyl-sn-glycerol-3-phosphate acyltransferase